MAVPLSLEEAKRALNMSAGRVTDDAELRRFLDAAIEQVEDIIGPVEERTVTEQHDGGSGVICLRVTPVLSVTSITAGNTGLYVTADLDVDTDTGLVRHISGASLYSSGRRVTVTYQAGRETVPAAVKVATGVILDHLWKTQRGWAAAPTARGEVAANEVPVPMGFALPSRAVQLLEPFRVQAV